MMKFMQIRNSADKSEIFIYGDIVDDSWNYGWEDDPSVYPKDIKSMLDGFNGQDIDVHINSGGGHVFAGMAICNMLKRYSGKTTAYVDGVAASAASIIAFGCDEIVIPSNAFLMIHRPASIAYGTAEDMLRCAEMLEAIQKGIVNTYKAKAVKDVTEEQINDMINAETWLTGAEATAYFNVQVADDVQALNCTGKMLEHWRNKPAAFNTKNNPDENKIKNMQQEIEIALAI